MKRVGFVICTEDASSFGYKLICTYPYGQTDNLEWTILFDEKEALFEKMKELQKKFDIFFWIKLSPYINSRSKDDFVLLYEKNKNLLESCKFILPKEIKYSNVGDLDVPCKNKIVVINYQKTFDFDYDFDRLLTDFENIINQ